MPSAHRREKTFCEFFAGIGLVRAALTGSDWRCVFGNDIDPRKKEAFESHFGPTDHFHLGDVWRTDDVADRIPGAPFLATASFPCTDLSLAGYGKGLAGQQSGSYFGFLKVLQKLGERKPLMVLLENVPSFLTSGGGKDFPAAMQALTQLGYWIDAFVVDARHFVPQSRPRLFVVAVHGDVDCPMMIRESRAPLGSTPWQDAMAFSGSLHPRSLIKIMEATELPTGWFTLPLSPPMNQSRDLSDLIDLGDDQEWWDEPRVSLHKDRMHDACKLRINQLLNDGATFVSTAYRRTRKGVVRTEVRFDGLAGCLRTTKGGSARQIVIVVKDRKLRMRWMSPREYARLQGAGDYTLTGDSQTQQMFGFGDAVCVPVIQWIDRQVLTPIYQTAEITTTPSPPAPLAV